MRDVAEPVPDEIGTEVLGEGDNQAGGVVAAAFEAMRRSDPARAAAWRAALRDVLSPLLAGGARVTGFDRGGWYVVSMERDER